MEELKDESLGLGKEEEEFEGSSEIEKSKIGIVRAIVEREDPSTKVLLLYLRLSSPSSLIDLAPLLYLSLSVSDSVRLKLGGHLVMLLVVLGF